jgi:hypothetical protein
MKTTRTAADKIRARIIRQRSNTKAAALVRLEKAHAVAHGAWADFALQTPGNTAEEQVFNVESCEFRLSAWLAFCRVYSDEKTALLGSTW